MRRNGKAFGILAAATSLTMLGGGLAVADSVVSDGDGVATPMTDQNWSVGTVCTNSTGNRDIPVVVTRSNHSATSNQTYVNSAAVSITREVTGSVTVTEGPKTIKLPVDWTSKPSGTVSSTVNFNVAYTAPATAGAFSATVEFTGNGPAGDGKTLTKKDNLSISGTATVCDTTDPTAKATGATSAGAYTSSTWTNKNVAVTLSGADEAGGSGLKELRYSLTGTATATSTLYSAPVSVTTEGTTTISYVAIDNIGNVSDPQSFVVKLDKTDPTVDPADVIRSTWDKTDVSQSFTASDTGSGLAAGSPANFTLTASAESADGGLTPTEDSQTITDQAGNSVTRKVSGLIDKSDPTISGEDVDVTTWRKTDLARDFTASDGKSDLANSADAAFTLTASANSVRNADGSFTATEVRRDVFDAVGNKATRVVKALIDKSEPTVVSNGPLAAVSTPNGAGWYNAAVTNRFVWTDALSGMPAGVGPDEDVSTGMQEGAEVKLSSGSYSDNAGNNKSAIDSQTYKIDLTAPTSTVSGVTEGAVYAAAPTVTCPGSDQLLLSGKKTDGTPSGNTSGPGPKTVTCNGATDNADNVQTVASQSVTYTVLEAGAFSKNFDGLSVPKAKAGSTLPLGWAFTDGTKNVPHINRVGISTTTLSSCTDLSGAGTTELAEVTAGSSGLQVLADGSLQVNWKSGTTTGCRRVTVKMYTGPNESDLFTSRSVAVNFTK